jgi:adenylate cyclase
VCLWRLRSLAVGFAAQRQWRDERFRHLYLSTTRERRQDISVLFGDLDGFTGFAERSSPTEVAALLNAYWGVAAPLITRRFAGELENFIGDGMMAVFNSRGDQPDHAVRAAGAALALQQELAPIAEQHPDWPRMRVGVNSGEAVVREIGGEGHVAYPLVGDTINTGSRLESVAPVGGVLIGAETFEKLPNGAVVEEKRALQVKGRSGVVHAYVLLALC